MFLFQHPEEYLRSLDAERERMESRNRLLRELRGATPPFAEAQTRRLAAAMATELAGDRRSTPRAQRAATPCPEVKEAMTT